MAADAVPAHPPIAALVDEETEPLLASVIPFRESIDRRRIFEEETHLVPPASDDPPPQVHLEGQDVATSLRSKIRRRSLLERLAAFGVNVPDKLDARRASGWR
jgi:hypothetical protein